MAEYGIISKVVSKVVYPPDASEERRGKRWIPDEKLHTVEFVDDAFSHLLPLCQKAPIKQSGADGGDLTSAQVAASLMQSFHTIVLATVMAGGWRANWISSFVLLVIASYRECSNLRCFAVAGGDACKAEIQFIILLLYELGFERAWERKYDKYDSEDKMTLYGWKQAREGAGECKVLLYLLDDVESPLLAPQKIATLFAPTPDCRCRPHLTRCAVVSSPVSDKDGKPIASRLNASLGRGLKYCELIAEKQGFMTAETWDEAVEWGTDLEALDQVNAGP